MYDIVALGELLVDFTESGYSAAGMKLFEQNAGGAPCNMLAAAAKFGKKTAFIGKVGNDMHGKFLKETIEAVGIDTRGLIVDDTVFTTLAFVAISDDGERVFSFARKPGADTCIAKEDLKYELLESCKVFHFGSLSLTNEPAHSATLEAIKIAKRAGAVISYDPNYRSPLWDNAENAAKNMRLPLESVDIMKLSDEETELLTGYAEPDKAAAELHKKGVVCVATTLGKDGALVSLKGKGSVHIRGVSGRSIIDTTGAGDAFWGGFVGMFIEGGKRPDELALDDISNYAKFANMTAALCIGKRGGIPAMPSLQEVLDSMDSM